MPEGVTCYERDETLCEDQMCLRTECRLRNEGLLPSYPVTDRLRQLLGAFYTTVDVMKSARNKPDQMMCVWADDMKAVEDVMLFLEGLRDAGAPAQQPSMPSREEIARLVCCGTRGCRHTRHCIAIDPENVSDLETADAILALSSVPSTVRAHPADAKCTYCQGDGYINVHANLPDVKCEICDGTGVAVTSTDSNTP